MLLSQFPLTFHHIHNRMPCFIALLMTILLLIGMIDSCVPWEYIFKLNASTAASDFCEWVQVGIGVYIPHLKYQVKPPHLLGFQLLVLLPYVVCYRNHFFHLYQKDKYSESKFKFRHGSNHCKRVIEAANLHILIKQKSASFPRSFTFGAFSKLPIVFSTNLLYLFFSTAWRCCLLHLIKQNCLQKTFLRILILITHVSLYLVSHLELI